MTLDPLTSAPNDLSLKDQFSGSTTHGILDHPGSIIPNPFAEVLEVARGDLRIRKWVQLGSVWLIPQAPLGCGMSSARPDPSTDVYQVLFSHLSNILSSGNLMAVGELSQFFDGSFPPFLEGSPNPPARGGRLPIGSHFLTRRNSEGLTRMPLSR